MFLLWQEEATLQTWQASSLPVESHSTDNHDALQVSTVTPLVWEASWLTAGSEKDREWLSSPPTQLQANIAAKYSFKPNYFLLCWDNLQVSIVKKQNKKSKSSGRMAFLPKNGIVIKKSGTWEGSLNPNDKVLPCAISYEPLRAGNTTLSALSHSPWTAQWVFFIFFFPFGI